MNKAVEVTWSENEKEFMRDIFLGLQESKFAGAVTKALAQVCRKKWEIMVELSGENR